MAVRASRTSSSLNGLIIAITIFMGSIPAWPGTDRARSRLSLPTRREFAARPQPAPVESNAVPDRADCPNGLGTRTFFHQAKPVAAHLVQVRIKYRRT